MNPRRLTALLLTALVALVAACGGGDDSSSALDDALGYLPKNAPVVVTIDTDVNGEQWKNLDQLASKFPFAGQVKSQLEQGINQAGVSFENDVKPQLGNPLVVGSADAAALMGGEGEDSFVAVFRAKDGDKLRPSIERGGARKSGQIDGKDVYEAPDGSVVLVDGDTFVAANSRPILEAAVQRKGGDDKLSEDDFNAAFEDLPENPLVRVYGDAQALLASSPETAVAQQVKWVGGLRKFGVTVAAEGDGLAFDARVNTEGLSEQDLPIAGGDQSPQVARFGDWAVAQRNLAQTWRFIESVARTVDAEDFATFEQQKQQLGQQLGIDVEQDLIGQFSGDTTVAGGLDGAWAVRSQVRDPAAMRSTLDKLVAAGEVNDITFTRSGDLIKGTEASGDTLYFGMIGDVLVASEDAGHARQLAPVQPRPLDGVKGALVAVANGEAIAKAALEQSGQGGAGLFTGPIGDVTGYVTASPNGLRARVKLKVE